MSLKWPQPLAVVGFVVINIMWSSATFAQNPSTVNLDQVYRDESHCLTTADMRGDRDQSISCWCRDAIAEARYVYFTYVASRADSNLTGVVLSLEGHIHEECGVDYDTQGVTAAEGWKWTGPEVVRTYPSKEVIARIRPEMRGKTPWRGIPFTVQLVYRDREGHVTRTDTYASVEWEPIVQQR